MLRGAIHAVKWLETIEGLDYQYNDDYQNFPPLSAEEARNKFLSYPNDSYEIGWISSWYGKGISEIDEDVRRRIAGNDPVVFALAEKHHKLIKPVVQFWFKELGKEFNDNVYRKIINHNLDKLYKDLPEIIEFGKSVADNLPFGFLDSFINKTWAQEYIPIAAENCAEKEPDSFLHAFTDEPWAKPYITTAAKKCADRYPYDFIEYFIDKPWAKEPIEDLGGKSLVQYAEEVIKKQSSYSPKLIKLAKVLKSLGLSKEAASILNLK